MGAATGARQDVASLDRPFRVIAFDWDGTAVMGRKQDARHVCKLLERLLRDGVSIVVVTGTNLANTVAQLSPLIHEAGSHNRHLFIATNRGSEVYGFEGRPQPVPLFRRAATPEEDRQLTAAAESVRAQLQQDFGLEAKIVYDRLNRRKIDLIPVPEWADPPKSAIGKLLEAVQARLFAAGVHGGLQEVLRMAERAAANAGLRDARVTSDVKHVEIGLTDKSDSVEWMVRDVCGKKGVHLSDVLIAGDEFGPIGGVEGSDHKMLTPSSRGAVFVSVGLEPGGVDPEILHLGGGPPRFCQILAAQADLRAGKRPFPVATRAVPLPLPVPVDDPVWTLVQEGVDLSREREYETIFSVGNGYLGTRAALAEHNPLASSPATFLAGVFDALPSSQAVPELALAPDWTRLRVSIEGREVALEPATALAHRRILDMKQGASWREWRYHDPSGRVTRLRELRMASLAHRHVALQVFEIVPENWSGRLVVEAVVEPASGIVAGLPVARPRMLAVPGPRDDGVLVYRTGGKGLTLALATSSQLEGSDAFPILPRLRAAEGVSVERWEVDAQLGETYRLERVASFYTSRDAKSPEHLAKQRLTSAWDAGASALAAAHAKAWRERWEACAIEVQGDPAAERALRFAAYHLLIAANPEDERVSIGARTLTGESYKGHVFWDTDVFMLPFFTFTYPEAARALLMYRYHTLDGARGKAADAGYRGALYAWESTDTGHETTPRFMLAPDGEVIPIVSGLQEHHISADIAYAAWSYWEATGDDRFMAEAGAEILLETACFWASRGVWDDEGRFHIRDVVGPDEYHEGVDDNAFTNGLARWNLRRGAEVFEMLRRRWPERLQELSRKLAIGPDEVEQWRRIAAAMELSIDAATGLIEQFKGYFALDDYDLAPMRAQGKRAAPMDMLLGREHTLRSRIVKQADVVMLLQLLWDEFPEAVREANFRYYEPRTCHGSSLSPSTHALVAAQLGDIPMAMDYFKQASEIDLANNYGNAAGGVHAAALGGLWQVAVFGFGGVRVYREGLTMDPRLPPAWRSLRFPLQFRGAQLEISVEADRTWVRSLGGKPVAVTLGEAPRQKLSVGEELVAARVGRGWRSAKEAP